MSLFHLSHDKLKKRLIKTNGGIAMFESVTHRVKSIKQPYGGYLPRKMFKHVQLEDDHELNPEENITGSKMGMVVDYLTRLMMGATAEEAFEISLSGAKVLDKSNGDTQATEYAQMLIDNIKGLDAQSIINACRITSYDVCLRAGIEFYNPEGIYAEPDKDTIENVVTIVNRTLNFWKEYGPITKDGFTFEGGGYTPTIASGDGDYLTKDTLWDLKVAKRTFNKNYSLQILVYYLMGQHSKQTIFDSITKIGLFNPRVNEYYILDIADIPEDTIETVETDVIGYPDIDNILDDAVPISTKNNLFYIENNLLRLNDDMTSYKTVEDDVEKSLAEHTKHEYWHKLGIRNKDLKFLKDLSFLYHRDKIIHDFKEENANSLYGLINDKDYDVANVDGEEKVIVRTSAVKKAIKENMDLDNPNIQEALEYLEGMSEPWYIAED